MIVILFLTVLIIFLCSIAQLVYIISTRGEHHGIIWVISSFFSFVQFVIFLILFVNFDIIKEKEPVDATEDSKVQSDK